METDNRPVSFLRSRKLIRVIAFLLVLVLLLAGSSALIRPKGYEAYDIETVDIKLQQMSSEKDGSIDVIFAGDSELLYAFSPLQLWGEYGMTSYIISSGGQKICDTYEILTQVFLHHSPKAVVLDGNSFYRDGSIYLEEDDKLLETADVFITNVREPSLARMGLDYASLKERYPRLVYAQFYGYGPKGPASEDPGFDSTAFWMRSGPVADWTEEGSKPFYPTYAFGDMATSSVFLSGILVALYARERTGRGTKVSTSLFASGIWCNATGVVSTQFETKHLNPDYSHPPSPFDGFYACAGGSWIAVYTNEYGRDRAKFARELGMEDILTDRRWDSVQALEESGFFREAAARVAAVFQTKSAAAWRDQLSRASISCEVMQRTCDVIRDEQALANDYIEPLDFGDGLRVMMPSPPLSFSAYHRRPTANTGRIGADTDAVLEELGYRREEICALRDEGAIL